MMQWMQYRPTLLACVFLLSSLCFTAPASYAKSEAVKATHHRIKNPAPSYDNEVTHPPQHPSAKKPSDAAQKPCLKSEKEKACKVTNKHPQTGPENHQHQHRFQDPKPGAKQHSVRYIEKPEQLKRLPPSSVLVNQKLPERYELVKVFQLKSFNTIVVQGNISVTLRNANMPRVAVMHENKPGRQLVSATVKNNTLYLKEASRSSITHPHPFEVLVDADHIHTVQLSGKSSLYAERYQNSCFNIYSSTTGNIILHAQLPVSYIEQNGPGMISIDKLKTNRLNIFAKGPGLIRLAGSVKKLDVRAIHNGKVDAKYLRTQDAWIQTDHHAEVAVKVDNSLNAFAGSHSFIYYYKTPEFITPRAYGSGNILQMRHWD